MDASHDESDQGPTPLRRLLAISVIVAILSFFAPWMSFSKFDNPVLFLLVAFVLVLVGLTLSVTWLVMFMVGAAAYGWRGLLLLIGAPFALYWPARLAWNWVPVLLTGKL